MLNRTLYDEMERVFQTQDILVVADGELGSYSCPKYEHPPWQKKRPKKYAEIHRWGETYAVDCPVCGDTKRRLFFSHMFRSFVKAAGDTGVRYSCGDLYVCHNERCNLWDYIKQMKIKDLEKVQVSTHAPEATNRVMSWTEGVMPPGAVPIVDVAVPFAAKDYLYKRGFDVQTLYSDFGVMFVPVGSPHGPEPDAKVFYEDRILIPIKQGNKVVSWQARSLDPNSTRKYLFAAGFKKSECLYNLDDAKDYNGIVICEGITDVWKVGKDAVAIFGKSMSRRQQYILSFVWSYNGSATVMLDSDALGAAQRIAHTLTEDKQAFPEGVRVAKLPSGDPGDHDPDEITRYINEAWDD